MTENIKAKIENGDFNNELIKALSYFSITIIDKVSEIHYEVSGTGSLLKQNGKVYLLSASHVFTSCKNPSVWLDNIIIGISGKIYHTRLVQEKDGQSIEIDIAIAELPQNKGYGIL